tara:strand:+ start:61 stop:288 length:228 start_codon:yes stop_codon:yes gene_type:complete
MVNKDIELKMIVSKFIKISPENISNDTIIDSTVLQGSVLFHRMISRVNNLYNKELGNYTSIATFGDLLKEIENTK